MRKISGFNAPAQHPGLWENRAGAFLEHNVQGSKHSIDCPLREWKKAGFVAIKTNANAPKESSRPGMFASVSGPLFPSARD